MLPKLISRLCNIPIRRACRTVRTSRRGYRSMPRASCVSMVPRALAVQRCNNEFGVCHSTNRAFHQSGDVRVRTRETEGTFTANNFEKRQVSSKCLQSSIGPAQKENVHCPAVLYMSQASAVACLFAQTPSIDFSHLIGFEAERSPHNGTNR